MDIAITKKKQIPKKYLYFGMSVLAAILLLLTIRALWFLSKSEVSIDKDSLVIDQVKRGNYVVSVRGTGLLVPDNIQWLSSNVDATVEKRVVKAGNVVKTGDLIVELKNPLLVQQLAEVQWDLEATEKEFAAEKLLQESALQQKKAEALNIELECERTQLEYDAHKKLVETGAVSVLDFERARLANDQFAKRLTSAREELLKMEKGLVAQNKARNARLNQKRKMLDRIQQQVDDLMVRATMDSIILDVPLEEGQRVVMGTNIAKLAQQDFLIAELKVPEIQIRDVAVGQKVVIDTRNNKFNGEVSRVDPAVINGTVQVDVRITDDLPDDARPDLSVDGEILVTEIPDTLYVGRPLFAQSRSRARFYKVSENEKYAERIDVVLGYGSVNRIQILDGLEAGDKIITSDLTRFESYSVFRIN